MSTVQAKSLISKAVAFFDITLGSKVDFTTEGNKTVYQDPLKNLIKPVPTDLGYNHYDIVGPDNEFRQEIHFQNGSPLQGGVNGVSNEAIIAVILHRLTKQNENYPSPYNVLAIYLLQGALTALHNRVKDRESFGISGVHQVEPTAPDDAAIAKALAIINSLGILGDVIIKYDSAYGLATKNRIQQYVEDLSKLSNQNTTDITLVSGFSLSTAAVMGSGIFRAFANIGSEMLKVFKDSNEQQQPKNAEDNSAGNGT